MSQVEKRGESCEQWLSLPDARPSDLDSRCVILITVSNSAATGPSGASSRSWRPRGRQFPVSENTIAAKDGEPRAVTEMLFEFGRCLSCLIRHVCVPDGRPPQSYCETSEEDGEDFGESLVCEDSGTKHHEHEKMAFQWPSICSPVISHDEADRDEA